jgi:hypothetical protein
MPRGVGRSSGWSFTHIAGSTWNTSNCAVTPASSRVCHDRRMRALIIALAFTVSAAHADPTQLAADRTGAAAKTYGLLHRDTVAVEDAYRWSVRWLDAKLDESPKIAKAALADHATRMSELEAQVKLAFDKGQRTSVDVAATAYFRIEADLWVARGRK